MKKIYSSISSACRAACSVGWLLLTHRTIATPNSLFPLFRKVLEFLTCGDSNFELCRSCRVDVLELGSFCNNRKLDLAACI